MVLVALTSLTGCLQPEKENLQQFVKTIQAKEKRPIAPIPEIKIHENFSYAAAELRDPFKATVVEVQRLVETAEGALDNGIRVDENRLKEALEAYELKDLRLVGVLEKGRRSGMVLAPDGVVHLINVGNYIGENSGKVLTITDEALTLREIVPGEKFAFVERENRLALE
jgi:type IV pilus assembly protein PilP